ncbi:MAG: baseplate J/gp47 family protein [Halobaculum sp.]
MDDSPVLDGRDRDAVLSWLTETAPYYVDDWDPERSDAGTVLFEIFADISEDVVERLDRVPDKQRAVFLNALDFGTQPPQPAKLPLTFDVGDVDQNVTIPLGTTVSAPATDDRPEQRFETAGDRKFEATPAQLTDVYAVDPGTDRIVDHTADVHAGEPTELFVGENVQAHEFYLGHTELLQLNPGSAVELELSTNAPAETFREYLTWEYFGENEAGEEGWHELVVGERQDPEITSVSEYQKVASFLDRLETFLGTQGFERVRNPESEETLVRALADDVRKGRFGNADDEDGPNLPPSLFTEGEPEPAVAERLHRRLESLRSRLGTDPGRYGNECEPLTLSLGIPGEITESEVDGVESRWIRCRIPDDDLSLELFETVVESARLSVGSEAAAGGTLPLDDAVNNDVALAPTGEGTIQPLGDNPTEASTFVFACEEAFTKPGADIELRFEGGDSRAEANDAEPRLVWEYWNGDGWRRLSVTDGTNHLQSPGTVSFEVPADVSQTDVMGHDRHWIRARLVSGNYGELKIEEVEEDNWQRVTDHISPPEYDEVVVSYAQPSVPFRHLLVHNDLSVVDVSEETGTFRPFESLDVESQSLYLGFDGPIRNGPINLYVPMEGAVYPHGFNPWTDVEYAPDPKTGQSTADEWVRLDLRDGTEDLTERGILSFALPGETTAFELFGTDRHWIRVRVTGDEFARSEGGLFVPTEQQSTSLRELSTETIAAREQSERTRTPPVVHGLHLNTAWGKNVETVSAETLGSSSGTANQTLSFDSAPVLSADVWVDELDALSQQERQRLLGSDETTVERETDDDGEPTAFWVEWTPVSDFLRSTASSRHYVLDRTGGEVRFGDGQSGAIPPAAENNVRADYETGGGDDGDVAVGAVDTLEDDVEFVESVTNPGPGETGEDEEPVEEFLSRAPKRLRDRDRPVTTDGFERIAKSAAREIEKVRCRGGFDETGAVGHVTLLVVPDLDAAKPVPADELLQQVETEMREKAPEAVVGREENLTVRGPNYLELSVHATVETSGAQSVTAVQESAKSALTEFVHPLTGGFDGEGWEIGTAPAPTVFTNRLDRVDAVERVRDIAVTYVEGDNRVTLSGGAGAPAVPPDVLVYGGQHTIDVEIGGG